MQSQCTRRYFPDSMFQSAFRFNQDIGNWKTGNVMNMAGWCKFRVLKPHVESASFQRLNERCGERIADKCRTQS